MAATLTEVPSRPTLRKYINQVLITKSDFDAFCHDHFPNIQRKFTADMDRVERVTQLLAASAPKDVLAELRRFAPESCEEYKHLLQEDSQYAQQTQLLDKKLEALCESKWELSSVGRDTTLIEEQIVQLQLQRRRSPNLAEKDILGERYSLQRKLGAGGFAEVWQASDLRDIKRKTVAVKVLHSQFSGERERLERFTRGALCMHQLGHPHIVPALSEPAEYEGFHFFVMEYCEGGSLAAAVGKTIATEQALTVILQTGDALAYMHNKGFVHRDVKPHNILLDKAQNARLSDFDLVSNKHSTGFTRTGMALGTFVYAAPESLDAAKDADCRADVFSLGMSAIYVLYGKELPRAAYQDQNKGFIAQLPCNEQIKQVLRCATRWDPAGRYPTMEALCAALKAAIVGQTTADPAPELAIEPVPAPATESAPAPVPAPAAAPTPEPAPAPTPEPAPELAVREGGNRRRTLVFTLGIGLSVSFLSAAAFRATTGHWPGANPVPAIATNLPRDLGVEAKDADLVKDANLGQDAAPVIVAAPVPADMSSSTPNPVAPKPSAKPFVKKLWGPFLERTEAVGKLGDGKLAGGSGRNDVAYYMCFSAAGNPQVRGLAFTCMGEAEFGRGRYNEAVKLGKLALKEKAADKNTYLLLGKAYYKLHNCKDAKSFYMRVLNSYSNNAEALAGMDRCQ